MSASEKRKPTQYRGRSSRINLAFYDLTDGPNIATASHIEEVYRFSERWAKAADSDPATANLVVHCFSGISRSSAIAMIPLLLYYRSEEAAAKRLYEINRWAAPNTHILYLTEEKFHLRGSLHCTIRLRSRDWYGSDCGFGFLIRRPSRYKSFRNKNPWPTHPFDEDKREAIRHDANRAATTNESNGNGQPTVRTWASGTRSPGAVSRLTKLAPRRNGRLALFQNHLLIAKHYRKAGTSDRKAPAPVGSSYETGFNDTKN